MLAVGFSRGRIFDQARSNWQNDGPRPIAWSAWYPVGDEDAQPLRAQGGFYLTDPVVEGALPRRGHQLPIVVMSHGTGGSVAGMSWLAHRLAAAGFLVLGIDHHGNTAVEPCRPEGFLCWWERAADVTAILDHHLTSGPFAADIDAKHIHFAGFSLGGYTALACLGAITSLDRFRRWGADQPFGNGPREFPDVADRVEELLDTSAAFRASFKRQSVSFKDERIRSALLCAPAPTVRGFAEETIKSIQTPILIFTGGDDREAPADACSAWLAEQLPHARYEPLGADVGHYVFLNRCSEDGCREMPDICIDRPGVERGAIHDYVAASASAFFSARLGG